jgi:hypothetical protein
VDIIVTDQSPNENLAKAIDAWGIQIHLATRGDHVTKN